MKSENIIPRINEPFKHDSELALPYNHQYKQKKEWHKAVPGKAEILVITSYPPRECGIATYSQDLITVLNHQFSNSFSIKVCALDLGYGGFSYPGEVKHVLNTSFSIEYQRMVHLINDDPLIQIVLIQHEFGLFKEQEQSFMEFLSKLTKPVVMVFHSVLPHPDEQLKMNVQLMTKSCSSIIVMTYNSAEILTNEYQVPQEKIEVIAHGTHLVRHLDEKTLKSKYRLNDRKVLTTFGLLSSGKGIETTLEALPAIIEQCPEVIFLVIGKTHPGVVKSEGERYREMLEKKIQQLQLQEHVRFVNKYLDLPELLEYLQLTDIYLFTSTDPNQAVSGTFSYAMSCSCPIISTPIPHAREILTEDTGIIIDFRNSRQLADAVIRLTKDDHLRGRMSFNTLQKIVSTAWENSAVAHARVFEKMAPKTISIHYNLPEIKLNHLKQMTTDIGLVQFSRINQPDVNSGYTLDDNARGLISMCMYYKATGDRESITFIEQYLGFIYHCQQPGGNFLNYFDDEFQFTDQNKIVNLDDAQGRAIWALGYLISINNLLPAKFTMMAQRIIKKSLPVLSGIYSTRSMAFAMKGLYYYHLAMESPENIALFKTFANRLVLMYKHESTKNWEWFESYLTYANSILPEAMCYAWLVTDDSSFKEIAISSMNFLLSQTFNENGIEVISSKKWVFEGESKDRFGELPLDVADTIMTLSLFYDVFEDQEYFRKMETAFAWFLGNNRLNQTVYNPCTGGCYDGLEKFYINLNQGAEAAVSYLMARLTMEKYRHQDSISMEVIPISKTINARHKRTIGSLTGGQDLLPPIA
ncbi:MAG: glycosyltransferase [Prolixibacteraceae bacterium]|nr:glycosyltransferase [Prolixibacteraceae bacterium]